MEIRNILENNLPFKEASDITYEFAFVVNGTFSEACYYGDYSRIVELITTNDLTDNDWCKGFAKAVLGNYLNILKYIVKNYTKLHLLSWNLVLYRSVRFGYLDIVKLIVENARYSRKPLDIFGSLSIASENNNIKIIQYLKSLDYDENISFLVNEASDED